MLDELGIGFVSPAMYPPLLRRIATSIYPLTLKQIGSFINTIGPFLCPFKLAGQLCGVRSQALMLPFSEVAQQLDIKNVALVWSDADMDEFCSVGCNHIYWPAQDGHQHTLTGRSLGMQQLPLTDLAGGTPETNASLMKNLLNNTAPEIAIDTVILNAAYLLRLHNLSLTTVDAIGIAKEAINSGQASRLLTRAIECSHDLSNIH